MRVSASTIIIGASIVISASFARQLMDLLKSYLGDRGFFFLIGVLFIGFILVFLIYVIKNNHPGVFRSILLLFILIIGLTLMWKIKIIEERIHILEYGLLGWFAARDLILRRNKTKGVILACALVGIFGIIDEVFQKILPYRVGEARDVVLNGLGGLWGISLYITAQK